MTAVDVYGSLTRKHYDQLRLALGPIDLDDDERRIVEWLAGWDQPTIAALLSIIEKLKAL